MDTHMAKMTATDKRSSDRIRTFLRAQIIFNNRMTTIECIVKNIAPDGARVALDETIAVPTEFELYIPQRGRSYHAHLVWRDADSIGVDFVLPQATSVTPQVAAPCAPDAGTLGGEARVRDLELQNAELKARIRHLCKRLEDLGQDPSNAF